MSTVALAFAVLDGGGSAADLGYVFAAGVVPQVAFMLGGGVVADRLGRRPVMLAADLVRFAVQAALAAALLTSAPPIWLFVLLEGLLGTGEAFFAPSLTALTPDIAPPARLSDANALRDLADGWAQFRSRTWLWVTTLQFALFNLFTWAPFLLLGPVLAKDYLGGARAWGTIAAAIAAGSIVAGALLVGRRPRRPLVAGVIGTFGYPVPCLLLALHAPAYGVAAGALAAGAGSAVFNTFSTTVLQQQVPPEMLARVTAFMLTGASISGGTCCCS